MDVFRIVVEAAGGHGCRCVQDDCDQPRCPDCLARQFVRQLKDSGVMVRRADLVHWPADLGYDPEGQMSEDLLTGRRTGEFPERTRH